MVRMRSPWAGVEAGWLATATAAWLLWLALPDERTWELLLTIAAGVAVAAGLLWVQSAILIAARRRGETVKAWRGAALLAGLVVLWWVVTAIFDAGQLQDASRATGWSAGFSGARRSLFTEDRLLGFEGLMWSGLRWVVTAALLPLAMEGAAMGVRGGWLRRAGAVLRRPVYWLSVVAGGVLAEAVLRWVLGWTLPGGPEVARFGLAVIKVGLAFALGAGTVCFGLALTGTYLRDAERGEALDAVAGAPGAGSAALAKLLWSSRLREK